MVTRSIDNWEKHKQDVYEVLKKKYGEVRATKFISFYKSRYDKFGRSFIDYKLAFQLVDDYHFVKRVGTKWYACVGSGGTGKTTLLKNIMYFLDPTFNVDCTTTTVYSFVKKLRDFKTVGSMKALFMDEPDDDLTSNSKAGKVLRKILGKARQQKLFLGFCATDLKDIPPYIFRKLDGIFFLPYWGTGMYFENQPKRKKYVVQEIRNQYGDRGKGYGIFFQKAKDIGCLRFTTLVKVPLDNEQEKQYLRDKKKDYELDIDNMLGILEPDKKGKKKLDIRTSIIGNMVKNDKSDKEIAADLGLSRARVTQIRLGLNGNNHFNRISER